MKPDLEDETFEQEAERTVKGLLSAVTGKYTKDFDMSQPTIYQIRDGLNLRRCRKKPTSTHRGLYREILKIVFLNHGIDADLTNLRLREIRTPQQLVNYIVTHGKSYTEMAEERMNEAELHYTY